MFLHERDIETYSLYRLYKFREGILMNNNKMSKHIFKQSIDCIDKVIKCKYNGNSIITLSNDIYIIRKRLLIEDMLVENERNDLLLKYFKKIEESEILLEISFNSLLTFEEKMLKIKVNIDRFGNFIKEKLLLCSL
tara:strand:- start:139 stop:546 length:408 start_codon:yes stop_codon:yes gene_type:complete